MADNTHSKIEQLGETEQIPFDAGWPQGLQHRPDPNRVSGPAATMQVLSHARRTPPVPAATLPPASPPAGTATTPGPAPFTQGPVPEPSYYDVSPLKAPLWKWEIASYFFLGGLSAGSYVIGRMAERHGGAEYRDVSRAGAYVALLSFLPCPPLLIHDLGDPARFHHMLRVIKPTSPMSLGTWAIMGYSGMATAEAFRQWMLDRYPPHKRGTTLRLINRGVELLHDAAGVPFALGVAGYTGVLLSCTSNPLWSKNKRLGPLFTASAVATGAAATTLGLSATARKGGSEKAHRILEKIDSAAHVGEAVCLAGYFKEAGPKAAALKHGSMRRPMAVATGGLIAAEVLKFLPFRGRPRRWAGLIGAAFSLVSGFSLRWAIVHGGHEAANDPHTARLSSRPARPSRPAPRHS